MNCKRYPMICCYRVSKLCDIEDETPLQKYAKLDPRK